MFLKWLRKSKKIEKHKQSKDTFSIAEIKQDGKTFLLRFKENQQKIAESGKYPYQIGIATSLYSGSKGFPAKEENIQLLNMETILEKDFSIKDIAIFVGAITGGGVKEFIFYTGKPQEASKILEKLKNEIKHHDLQYIIQKDPTWDTYKMFGPPQKN